MARSAPTSTPGVATTLIGETAYAIARSRPTEQLTGAYITVLMDGLRPPSR